MSFWPRSPAKLDCYLYVYKALPGALNDALSKGEEVVAGVEEGDEGCVSEALPRFFIPAPRRDRKAGPYLWTPGLDPDDEARPVVNPAPLDLPPGVIERDAGGRGRDVTLGFHHELGNHQAWSLR